MANLYENFENRFTNKWFASDWSDVETKLKNKQDLHKDLNTLQNELLELEEKMEGISQKQLRLANLAKLYNL